MRSERDIRDLALRQNMSAQILGLAPDELQADCDSDPTACMDDSIWEKAFAEAYPDVYGIFNPFAVPEAVIDKPGSDRFTPTPWRSVYTDLLNLSYFDKEGLSAVEDLLNGEQNLDVAEKARKATQKTFFELFEHHPQLVFLLALALGKGLLPTSSALFADLNAARDSDLRTFESFVGKSVAKILYGTFGAEQLILKVLSSGVSTGLPRLPEKIVEKEEQIFFDLIYAHETSDIELVRLLLSDPRIELDPEDAPLITVAAQGHTDVMRLLLADPRFDPTEDDELIIGVSSSKNSCKILKLLLEDGRVDPGAEDNSPILEATYNGATENVKLLLDDDRVDPRANNNESIISASLGGYVEILRLLLADGRADPRADESRAIRLASERGNCEEIVLLLLADGRADPSGNNNQAIREASQMDDAGPLRLLLADDRVNPSIGDVSMEILSFLAQEERIAGFGLMNEPELLGPRINLCHP